MLSEQRRKTILALLDSRGSVTVNELVAQLGVSEMTVRRDLGELECQGFLRRVHGGAVSARGRSYEPPFLTRSLVHKEEKVRIAAAAVARVHHGDSITLDVGTTTLEIAHQLAGKRDLTVITPSLRIAMVLAEQPGIRLILTGGILRPGELSLVGAMAEQAFLQFFADKLFLGIGGIDLEAGLTEFNLEDALVKKAMLRRAKEIIVVADASKFGKIAFASVAPLDIVHTLITDSSVPPSIVNGLRDKGIEVIIV